MLNACIIVDVVVGVVVGIVVVVGVGLVVVVVIGKSKMASVWFLRMICASCKQSSIKNVLVILFRHHTNPVGTEWKWKMDSPESIYDAAISYHVGLIKQFRGGYILSHLQYIIMCLLQNPMLPVFYYYSRCLLHVVDQSTQNEYFSCLDSTV